MTANAWGQEPSTSIRFNRNNVRVSITPPADAGGTFYVSCGLFRTYEQGGGSDEPRNLSRWASHDVPSLEWALRLAEAALDRSPFVWDLPTWEVLERLQGNT